MGLPMRAALRSCAAASPSCGAREGPGNAYGSATWAMARGRKASKGTRLRPIGVQFANETSRSARQDETAQLGSVRARASKTGAELQSAERPAESSSSGSGRDPDLSFVLEIASDEELQELSDVLYGRSLLSPLMKSVAYGDGTDSILPGALRSANASSSSGSGKDSDGSGSESEVPWAGSVPPRDSPLADREAFLSRLETRFFFLSADARGTLSGARPTYREVLQSVRERLGVECSPFLATPDLEAEIFLHLCNNYGTSDEEDASERTGGMESAASKEPSSSSVRSALRKVLNEGALDALRRVADRSLNKILDEIPSTGARGASSAFRGRETLKSLRSGVRAALDMSRDEILTTVLKGSSAMTVSSLWGMAAKKLGMQVIQESVKYQVASRIVEQGSRVVAAQVESRIAMYAAQKSATALASRYIGLRAAMSFLGPVLWGAFFADIALQSLGTDYARIIRAIYTIAQIRLTRTYGWTRGDELKDT